MTTRVTYIGAHDEVETTLDGKPVILGNGESIEVSDEQAHLLRCSRAAARHPPTTTRPATATPTRGPDRGPSHI
jgi:hypothetical protein